jgi:hypothetical protein
MAPGLDDSIEALYRVFERYPLRPSTEPCPHCHDPGEEGVLHEHLLRDLTAQQLSGFAGEALTVWGDVVDFKHFLPRIMEITVSKHTFDWPDTESLFGRLAYGRWREWPSDEQQAVEQFLHAYWRDGLGRYPTSDDIGSMLTAIAATDVDLTPFLDWWIEQPGEEPLRHLAEFAELHGPLLLARGRIANAFWGAKQRPAADVVVSWIASGRPRERLVDGFFTAASAAIEEALSNAVRVLESLEALPHAG